MSNHTLHIADPANINRARCGLTLTRQAGDLRGQWWWHDEGHHATRADVPPGVDAVATRDGLTVCAACRPANLGCGGRREMKKSFLERLTRARHRAGALAASLGCETAYNDCVGGDLRGEGPAQEHALSRYRRLARAHDAYVHGPERREYYSRED